LTLIEWNRIAVARCDTCSVYTASEW